MIERLITSDIVKLARSFPVVCIIGPRQSGKTTLVKSLNDRLRKKSLYLDLELNSDMIKLSDPELFLKGNQDDCIIIDEVQRMPGLFPLIRALVDQNRKAGRFMLLGSADPKLIQFTSESLAGRIAYKELSPFNLLEVKDKLKYKQHWMRGGFPLSTLAKNNNLSIEWLDNFISTYLEKDLAMLGLSVSPVLMRKFWTMIANSQGSILNMSNYSKSLGISVPSISRYLDFLEGAFIIHRLYPYSSNIKKRLVKQPKVYIRDSGILHRLLEIKSFSSLEGNVIIGNSWEGYVIEQIKQTAGNDLQLYFYRTHDGTETDLVLTRAGKPVCSIEIKYTSSPSLTKGNTIAINDLKTKNNFVLTPESDDYIMRKDVRVCSLEVFLGKYLKKL